MLRVSKHNDNTLLEDFRDYNSSRHKHEGNHRCEEIQATLYAMKEKYYSSKTHLKRGFHQTSTNFMQKNARKRNGYVRHCGKIPVHYGQKSRCIMGRNQKFLFLYSFGLTPCSLARQLLGIEKTVLTCWIILFPWQPSL